MALHKKPTDNTTNQDRELEDLKVIDYSKVYDNNPSNNI